MAAFWGGRGVSFYVVIHFSIKRKNFSKSEANLPHAHVHTRRHTHSYYDHKYQLVVSVISDPVGQNIVCMR